MRAQRGEMPFSAQDRGRRWMSQKVGKEEMRVEGFL